MDPLSLIVIVLLVLWLTGTFAFHAAGGAIHILLVIALVIVVVRLARGDRFF